MVKKEVEIDPRVAKQDAKNAVRTPIDALIELVTNSMDSYNRMKGRGEKVPKEIDGKIEIYLTKIRSEKKAIIACKDWAEGISPDKMEKYISGYGARTSGKETFQSIRGYFGRGLKDAAGGLDGIGLVYSVKDGIISVGKIDGRDKNRITYDDKVDKYPATPENLQKHHLDDGSKTIAMVVFSTENITVPQFDTLAEKLTLCVQLRPLMENGNIKLIQIENGKVKNQTVLKYNTPLGTRQLIENNNIIPGEIATYDIEIYKADEPLTQSEEGKYREGGLLIMSGTSVHEATLLKFEKDPNASKFFGKVRCDYIDELMRKDEAVVTPDRQGLNWDHPFMKKLKEEIEKKLQPFIEAEKKERNRNKKGIKEDVLKRNEAIGKKLGKLYKEILEEAGELGSLSGTESSDENEEIKKPVGGFGFIPDFYLLECKKVQKIRLLVNSPEVFPSYETIEFKSDNPDIIVNKKSCSISEGEYLEKEGIYVHKIEIFGNKPGEGKIVAIAKDKSGEERTAEAAIRLKEPEGYPLNGFSFVPSEYRLKVGKISKLLLKIDGELITDGSMKIKVVSNNSYILVESPEIIIPKEKGIIEKEIVVKGTRTGESGIVTAIDTNNLSRKAEAKVKVISPTPTSSPQGFNIEFDDSPPIQRAVCAENTIYIYINEPTVKMYYGENGEYADTLSFQVLCADLITDAFCTKVVEELDRNGKISYLGEDKETAIRKNFNNLKMRYGPIIHKTYVNRSLLEKERGI